MAPRVILYAYPQSPFAQKLELVLLFKRIDYSYVEVPRIPPRDALQKLGITYRRIPVLAIGADLYLDTSLATIALEDAFPEPSLKGRSWGLQTASAFFWSDRSLFPLAAGLLPWDSMVSSTVVDSLPPSELTFGDVAARRVHQRSQRLPRRRPHRPKEDDCQSPSIPLGPQAAHGELSCPTPAQLGARLTLSSRAGPH